MAVETRLTLSEIECRVCDIAAEHLLMDRGRISPSDRLIEDLRCDSLELLELMYEVEERLGVALPDEAPDALFKAVFTRQPFRLSDLAEAVYLQQGTAAPDRRWWRRPRITSHPPVRVPFTQLDGVWIQPPDDERPLIEKLASDDRIDHYRRRSDGMRVILIPAAEVEIGCNLPEGLPDERPQHAACIDAFLIDAEPVSTAAYCRFLNSLDKVDQAILRDWFALDADDRRNAHVLIEQTETGWQPVHEAGRWPMVLVSWFGANAYSLWANGRDWRDYRDAGDAGCFLPTEGQWEYAARGPRYRSFPWGNDAPSPARIRYGEHRKGLTYEACTLPLAEVNERLGMSPLGLHHMAGNVWQWCRDWYDEDFYASPAARARNPFNRAETGIKSERGGSWIGPAELCRSSFRRGRPPHARGRCLGFRCVSMPAALPNQQVN